MYIFVCLLNIRVSNVSSVYEALFKTNVYRGYKFPLLFSIYVIMKWFHLECASLKVTNSAISQGIRGHFI